MKMSYIIWGTFLVVSVLNIFGIYRLLRRIGKDLFTAFPNDKEDFLKVTVDDKKKMAILCSFFILISIFPIFHLVLFYFLYFGYQCIYDIIYEFSKNTLLNEVYGYEENLPDFEGVN